MRASALSDGTGRAGVLLSATVNSGGFEIGSYANFVDVAEAVADVTPQIDYPRAGLAVESSIETSLERSHRGGASIESSACSDAGTSGAVR